MSEPRSPIAVGYVLKRYPRFSETFVVNEILALEKAGVQVDIFALGPVSETHFQEAISRVRAPVHRIRHQFHDTELYWQLLVQARKTLPEFRRLAHLADEHDWVTVGQAVLLAMQAQSKDIRHLHAHFGTQAATVARLAAAFAGIHYSFTAHAKDIFHEEVVPAELATKLREAHTTVTVSEYNRRHLQREFGAAADRVTRLYNSVDLQAFPFATKGETAGPDRIAAVGRLVEKKGFGDLLTAVAELVGAGRDVHVDLVGTGPLEATLRERIGELGLGDVVTMHGALPQSRVREIVAAADVFAAPCVVGADGNRDGLPTVLLEALALGTPCVSTPVTGIPEIVRHEETGLLAPESDPAALGQAIARVLDDPETAAGWARAARRLLEADFDFRDHARELQGIFAAAIASQDDRIYLGKCASEGGSAVA